MQNNRRFSLITVRSKHSIAEPFFCINNNKMIIENLFLLLLPLREFNGTRQVYRSKRVTHFFKNNKTTVIRAPKSRYSFTGSSNIFTMMQKVNGQVTRKATNVILNGFTNITYTRALRERNRHSSNVKKRFSSRLKKIQFENLHDS